MKNWQKIGIAVTVLVAITVGFGVKHYMDKVKLQDEMVRIVKSEEAQSVIEEGLKNIDTKAFTTEGVIQSYKVDYEDIEHNPMGGIMVMIYVNDDSSLYIQKILSKKNQSGKLYGLGSIISPELTDLLDEGEKTNE